MNEYDLRKRIRELKSSLGLIESELSERRDVTGTLEDFKHVVDRARRSVWAVLTASVSGDYNAFIADFRLRRATEMFQEIHVDLDAGGVNAATPGLHELESNLSDLVEALPVSVPAAPNRFQTRISGAAVAPPKSNPDLTARIKSLREQLDMMEETLAREELPRHSLEDLKVAVDNVRTGVLMILSASNSERYSEMIGSFRVSRAAQITLNVHSDLVLGVLSPDSPNLLAFARVATTLLERLEVLCGGALRRLSQELPALQG